MALRTAALEEHHAFGVIRGSLALWNIGPAITFPMNHSLPTAQPMPLKSLFHRASLRHKSFASRREAPLLKRTLLAILERSDHQYLSFVVGSPKRIHVLRTS